MNKGEGKQGVEGRRGKGDGCYGRLRKMTFGYIWFAYNSKVSCIQGAFLLCVPRFHIRTTSIYIDNDIPRFVSDVGVRQISH